MNAFVERYIILHLKMYIFRNSFRFFLQRNVLDLILSCYLIVWFPVLMQSNDNF